ncbi:MAG: SpoIIIAC/SpoIIIAD family protein [Christensenellales bacterium]|jgi:stage III sporulation protein AD
MIKIVSIGIIGALLTLVLRQLRPELAMLCALITGAVLVFSIIDQAALLLAKLAEISARFETDAGIFSTMLKITGVAYIAEFGVQACRDAGENAIASKVELGGKVVMLGLCVPVVVNLLELLSAVLP